MSYWRGNPDSALREITGKQQAILGKAEQAKRGLTQAEEREYAELETKYELLSDHMTRNEPILPLSDRQWREGEEAARRKKAMNSENTSVFDADGYKFDTKGKTPRDIFNRYINYGADAIGREEYRALQANKDVAGGFLVVPTEVAKRSLRISTMNFF